MKHITFVSNYINHHQIPLCDELYRLTDKNFTFLQTEPMSEERIKMGWNAESGKPYVVNYYDNPKEGDRLILEDDGVIFGGAQDQSLILPRLEAGKFTVRYSERIYKEGRWKFISPRGLREKYINHIRFKDAPVYMLCAGAHVAGDFSLIHAYKNKMLRFGYFPKVETYGNVHEVRDQRTDETPRILWAARMIDWKHPEMMIELAIGLKRANIPFQMELIGDGVLYSSIREEVKERGMDDCILLPGALPAEQVRKKMREADIFVVTSDRLEGWGAVVGEAMNEGCITIAPFEIGAALYLIKDHENGMLYHANDRSQLLRKVTMAIKNPRQARKMATAGYETMVNLWNAKVAAKRLYEFMCDENHTIKDYDDKGPMSRA